MGNILGLYSPTADWRDAGANEMKITEKELSRILQRPGYSAHAETKRYRQPTPRLPEGSKHELRFMRIWDALNGPELEREYRFDPTRRWRIDFYHHSGVAIEIEGFGHGRPNRYKTDVQKYNRMAEMGITLIRLTSDMITVQELERIIERIKVKS